MGNSVESLPPSLVSSVVLVQGGERVGVVIVAVGIDVVGVGSEGEGRVGAASAVLAVGQRDAQVGLKERAMS